MLEFLRKHRVIDALRRSLPGEWKYDPRSYTWVRADGLIVERVALWTGWEDSYISRFRRNDTMEVFNPYV